MRIDDLERILTGTNACVQDVIFISNRPAKLRGEMFLPPFRYGFTRRDNFSSDRFNYRRFDSRSLSDESRKQIQESAVMSVGGNLHFVAKLTGAL